MKKRNLNSELDHNTKLSSAHNEIDNVIKQSTYIIEGLNYQEEKLENVHNKIYRIQNVIARSTSLSKTIMTRVSADKKIFITGVIALALGNINKTSINGKSSLECSKESLLLRGIWPHNIGVLSRLPEFYKSRYIEKFQDDNLLLKTTIHYEPPKDYFVYDQFGLPKVLNRNPPKTYLPSIADKSLWDLERVVYFVKETKFETDRQPRFLRPNLERNYLYSEILNVWLTIVTTETAYEAIDQCYGIDGYIMKSSESKIGSMLGMMLKRRFMRKLYEKDCSNEILSKFNKYLIPKNEIDWLGLTLYEAEKRQRYIELMNHTSRGIPTKYIYSKSFKMDKIDQLTIEDCRNICFGYHKIKINKDNRKFIWSKILKVENKRVKLSTDFEYRKNEFYKIVTVDIDRITYLIPNVDDEEKEDIKSKLKIVVMELLLQSPKKYYQGFHEVCLTVMLTVGFELSILVMDELTNRHLLYYTTNNFGKSLCIIDYLLPLIKILNPKLESHLEAASVDGIIILSWLLTWFLHIIKDYDKAIRYYDICIASPVLFPVYLSSVIINDSSSSILSSTLDTGEISMKIQNLPLIADQSRITCQASQLYHMYPPTVMLTKNKSLVQILGYDTKLPFSPNCEEISKIIEQNNPQSINTKYLIIAVLVLGSIMTSILYNYKYK
ncbi:39S ribosomal protein L28, mitochondrial [Intoshia linei]|uniref:39S ribosomal protein L28, mitochondrial n=1 Tax=Intoshia linei TaxID=1819745 RepID=A0A177B2I2_9BILA|nr:39S ribosomal protein L28, mitochondrial [Intoshia linei]